MGIQESVTKDCSLILETIRRLREGTWQLAHEDSDWADFLLPKIEAALKDHIEYESLCIFSKLETDLAKEHACEHENFLVLFQALEQAKQEKDFEAFHILLDLLVTDLKHHHENFDCYSADVKQSHTDCATERIVKRAQGSILE